MAACGVNNAWNNTGGQQQQQQQQQQGAFISICTTTETTHTHTHTHTTNNSQRAISSADCLAINAISAMTCVRGWRMRAAVSQTELQWNANKVSQWRLVQMAATASQMATSQFHSGCSQTSVTFTGRAGGRRGGWARPAGDVISRLNANQSPLLPLESVRSPAARPPSDLRRHDNRITVRPTPGRLLQHTVPPSGRPPPQ